MENADKSFVEIYKSYVAGTDAVSSRRQQSNNYFLAINAIILGTAGYAAPHERRILLSIMALLLCVVWILLIRSFRNLNQRKFMIIREMETLLPTAPFSREWEGRDVGAGIRYVGVSRLEMTLPLAFGLFHLWLTIVALIS